MDRRKFIGKAALAAAASTAMRLASHASDGSTGTRTQKRPEGRPPNVLFAIADDWGWPHASCYGDRAVKTPNFDRLAREGVLFNHAYCSSPSCSPSRASILTGRAFWQLEEGACLWGTLPAKFPVYPEQLEAAGYVVGLRRKGWGPGSVEAGGRKRNGAGPSYTSFDDFLRTVPEGKPFCFWFGTSDPHRPYAPGSGSASGIPSELVQVPPFLPDAPEVRNDILDYYYEVQRFDREVGEILRRLEAIGQLDNTIVVMTSDNGMPFPRCKTNLYDHGTRLPLVIRWGARVRGGRTVDDFVSFSDFAPTFLEAAGLKPPEDMTGRSFLNVLTGNGRTNTGQRDRVYTGRERHTAFATEGRLGYPMRAVRTREFLYIRNFASDRWPAGQPDNYADVDDGPAKTFMLENAESEAGKKMFALCFGKRPPEELYRVADDPYQVVNLAEDRSFAPVKKRLREDLERYLTETRDPRLVGDADAFDRYPYFGPMKK